MGIDQLKYSYLKIKLTFLKKSLKNLLTSFNMLAKMQYNLLLSLVFVELILTTSIDK